MAKANAKGDTTKIQLKTLENQIIDLSNQTGISSIGWCFFRFSFLFFKIFNQEKKQDLFFVVLRFFILKSIF
ncbi:hypothetical protein KQ878_03385 [Mycoplasma zalophidermidis]|uniref:Uncharacterized protein n=1 Tax=Mycoplasma zalophidermidis TaxID=398174 RepID=A0ABS6DSC2_9MOLU|nr:hypothetical protein [Mycoplasma zalophidermidis]MBU4693910.1 hypothetical protein [Mycoplasma zalophidermidis]